MAANEPDAFLRAEEDAQRLVDELERLKEETESYHTSREALDQAATRVGDLSTRCAEVAQQLGTLAETLRAIGTPELLEGLRDVGERVQKLQTEVERTGEAGIKAQRESTDRALQGMAKVVQLIKQELANVQQAVVKGHRDDVAEVKAELRDEITTAGGMLRTVWMLTFVNAGLLVLAVAILVWMLATR